MGSNKPYNQLESIEVPESTRLRVFARLAEAQKGVQRTRTILYGVCSLVSVLVCLGSGFSVFSTLSQSGTLEFIALIFKDTAALSYSKDLFLSIVESVPLFTVAFLFGSILFSGITLPRFIRNRSLAPLYA